MAGSKIDQAIKHNAAKTDEKIAKLQADLTKAQLDIDQMADKIDKLPKQPMTGLG